MATGSHHFVYILSPSAENEGLFLVDFRLSVCLTVCSVYLVLLLGGGMAEAGEAWALFIYAI